MKVEKLENGERPDGYLMRGVGAMVTRAMYPNQHKFEEFEEEQLVLIGWEDDLAYYGNFPTGFGFFGLTFPKNTTRILTEKEANEINKKKKIQHSNGIIVEKFLLNKDNNA